MRAMPGPVAGLADPVVSACFELGWRMEELFSRFVIPEHPPEPYDSARLIGLSSLNSYDWQRLGLDQADFVVGQVTAALGSPTAVPLHLTADARGKLDAAIAGGAGSAERRKEYREALGHLHVDLLVVLSAAGPYFGKAYGLGRALADTTRPHQSPGQFATSFGQHRIGQLYLWLDELASLLPEHASRSVSQSLGWWEQAVSAASGIPKRGADAMPAGYPGNERRQPSRWRQMTARLKTPSARRRPVRPEPLSVDELTAAVARQGGIWRRVLTGEKLCTDMLAPQDYLRAGDRLARHYSVMARQALLAFLPWLVVLLIVLAAVIVVLVLAPGSAVARTATAAAASAGTFSGVWKIIQTRVGPIAAQLDQPLWGGELDTATAEAITIPPVGGRKHPE